MSLHPAPSASAAPRTTGGRLLVKALLANGVDRIFCVPGESYLAALDALHDTPQIKVVTCRHEGGAAFMAEAYAKLTRKPGVCFVTRGPGATNASIGVHTAMQDSTPMILLVGQVARGHLGREAFQEIDYTRFFAAPVTKGAFEVTDQNRIAETVMKGFSLATSGRKGPVVISLPEDVLSDACEDCDAHPAAAPSMAPSADSMAAFAHLLQQAKKPIVIVGGSGWSDAGSRAIAHFARSYNLPVITTFRRNDVFENGHPNYAGSLGTTIDPKLMARIADSDFILAIGTRLSEIATQGYELLTPPKLKQAFVHVYADPDELGRVYCPDVAICCEPSAFAMAAKYLALDCGAAWRDWCHDARADYDAFSTLTVKNTYTLDMDAVFADLGRMLPDKCVITTDAGNFSGWAQRYLKYGRTCRLLAPTSGAMGYGIPAAIAASIADPATPVICFVGDGGFQMTGHELATAVQTGAKPVIIVCNNGMYGTIRMHQEKTYPGRVSATDLVNPDFAALAKAYGLNGVTVTRSGDFGAAFAGALKSGKLSVIELKMDPQQISTTKTLKSLSNG